MNSKNCNELKTKIVINSKNFNELKKIVINSKNCNELKKKIVINSKNCNELEKGLQHCLDNSRVRERRTKTASEKQIFTSCDSATSST